MSRRRRNQLLVPGARDGLNQLKLQVMAEQGYQVNPAKPNDVKYEVARKIGVPLEPEYNGELSTKSVGKVGGEIGGSMVRELIRMAQEQLSRQS